jgi:hypothetical protein
MDIESEVKEYIEARLTYGRNYALLVHREDIEDELARKYAMLMLELDGEQLKAIEREIEERSNDSR